MGTRSQVKVVKGDFKDRDVTLYHSCDGYPGTILPFIGEAWKYANSIPLDEKKRHEELFGNKDYNNIYAYQLNRPGNVASFLCHMDPHNFEPESGNEIHGDIAWYYVVDVNVKTHDEEWTITVYSCHGDMDDSVDLNFVMSGRISDFLTRKNSVRKDVVLQIKSKTEDAYIGVRIGDKTI